jgi:hypothetical protein
MRNTHISQIDLSQFTPEEQAYLKRCIEDRKLFTQMFDEDFTPTDFFDIISTSMIHYLLQPSGHSRSDFDHVAYQVELTLHTMRAIVQRAQL